ncbi:MAG: hypothetical protein NVS4B12_17370 [Ktedonobacteraceae bacterium]
MSETKAIMKWTEIQNLPVTIPSEGITIGTVIDCYFKPDTNAIYALKVRLRLQGDRSLPVTGIRSISTSGVAIPSAQMLTERLPPLPLVSELPSSLIKSESGSDIGKVNAILLGTETPSTLRIVGIEMTNNTGKRSRAFGADAIGSYHDGTVVVTDTAAKRLK